MQEKIFLKEGDNWFERNIEHLKKSDDIITYLIDLYNLTPSRVFELGSSNGYRLAKIREKYKSYVVGLDPSVRACLNGKRNFSVDLIRGVGTKIPLKNRTFDLVIVNSVLHWIDRINLLKVISELDRMLKNDGHIIIGDFYPDSLFLKVKYHHLQDKDIFTYKQDYSSILTSSGIYTQIAKLTYDIKDRKFKPKVDMNWKFSVALLQKNLDRYLKVELKSD